MHLTEQSPCPDFTDWYWRRQAFPAGEQEGTRWLGRGSFSSWKAQLCFHGVISRGQCWWRLQGSSGAKAAGLWWVLLGSWWQRLLGTTWSLFLPWGITWPKGSLLPPHPACGHPTVVAEQMSVVRLRLEQPWNQPLECGPLCSESNSGLGHCHQWWFLCLGRGLTWQVIERGSGAQHTWNDSNPSVQGAGYPTGKAPPSEIREPLQQVGLEPGVWAVASKPGFKCKCVQVRQGSRLGVCMVLEGSISCGPRAVQQ